ncbi:hypothetical protein J2T57_000694 [Natronocella acetinitrilica]|uniref:FAD-dependent urate hydroxylase HpyO/Asp monooxygenase CreE-like FAD/NAD(P)-binding domain-containing protein n=1 Tax=Natronocella acetinitrilica TaxID=414046 RepID=A0AAE3KA11_9GAMM|nr:FAD/NAD(P)-binding protein [Natronocella acetinitrilica]MCP1673595.1 hypothetical protein [Natronocella acetinitrilica]
MRNTNATRKVAILGGGPKGLYGFERLAAWLNANQPSERIEIHIFNKSASFGAGQNYRADQPAYLLMNNPAGDVNMWSRKNPPPVVPEPMTLTEWLRRETGLDYSENDYATRAMAGRYLSHGFTSIAKHLPRNVHGRYIVGDVGDIAKTSGQYSLRVRKHGSERYVWHKDVYDYVLLATGHPEKRTSKTSLLSESIIKDKNKIIPYIYPTENAFSLIPPNCNVGMEGMGLTFIDATLALTEGKGGRFEQNERADGLLYIPSGNEPSVIYPYSRTGLPMIPRRSVATNSCELRFFTKSAFKQSELCEKLSFEHQIWPLVKQDMIYAYYRIAIRNINQSARLADCATFEDVERVVSEYHDDNPSEQRFDVEMFVNPLLEPTPREFATHDDYVQTLYGHYLREALKGEMSSPLAAVTAVWRKASPYFTELYAFGGLTPKSQQYFDESVRGKLNRVTFGPPVESAKKIHALMDSGLLNFEFSRNPDISIEKDSDSFIITSGTGKKRCAIHYLVDARIPKFNLSEYPDALFRNLIDRGLITAYQNNIENEVYCTGAVNITREGFVIDRKGSIDRGIAVTGTPTEGITFDNDTLSRTQNNFTDNWAEFVSNEYAMPARNRYAN